VRNALKTKEAGQRQVDILQRKNNAEKEDSDVPIHATEVQRAGPARQQDHLESYEVDQLQTFLKEQTISNQKFEKSFNETVPKLWKYTSSQEVSSLWFNMPEMQEAESLR